MPAKPPLLTPRCPALAAGVFVWLGRWPLGALHPLGWAMGWLAYGLSPSDRHRMPLQTQQAGAAVMVFCYERLSFWQRCKPKAAFTVYTQRASLATEAVLHGPDIHAETQVINQLMESLTMQRPEQYLWAYHHDKQALADMHTSDTAGAGA